MVLVYSYHPACVTLMNKYLSGGGGNNSNDANGAFHDPFSSDPDAPRPYTHQVRSYLINYNQGLPPSFMVMIY